MLDLSSAFAVVCSINPGGTGDEVCAANFGCAQFIASGGQLITLEYDYTPLPPSERSVPGPLPLLGGAAAFGWSRRLRRRLNRRPA